MPGGSLFVRRDDVGLRCANPTYGATALGVPRPWRDLRACMHPGILPGLALPVGLPERWRRVVRGGSWNNNQDNARASNRNNNHPNNRNNNIGFRLCCESHIGLLLLRLRGLVLARRVTALATVAVASGNACRPRFAGRGEGWINGAGESRPHGGPRVCGPASGL